MNTVTVSIREQAVRDVARLRGAKNVAAIGELIGKSESYTYRLLKGERECSWELLTELAVKLGVSPTTIADVVMKVAA